MSTRSPFRVDIRPDGVAVVVHAIGCGAGTLPPAVADELIAVVDLLESDTSVRAAIVAGREDDAPLEATDLETIAAVATRAEAEALCRKSHRAIDRLASASKPVVAVASGSVLGARFELALACRACLVSDDPQSHFGLVGVQIGLVPGLHGLQRLAGRVGLQVALDHGLRGRRLVARQAASLGMVDEVVPRARLLDVAARRALSLAGEDPKARSRRPSKAPRLLDLALETNPLGHAVLFAQARRRLLAGARGNHPGAERVVDVLEALARRGWQASCEAEATAFADLVVSSTSRRLVEIAVATTALESDTGVEAADVAPVAVATIGVVGAGLVGAGIACVSADAGIEVRLCDRDPAGLARGMKAIAEHLERRVRRGILTPAERDRELGLVAPASDGAAMAAPLVIEAVFEDLARKQRLLAAVEASNRGAVIFASSTSAIPIGRIAAAASWPERVVGMHYSRPVEAMPLLEVVRAARTAADVVATAVAVGKRQGKTAIVVNDGAGFYTSRILAPLVQEARWLLTEGASVEEIDDAMIEWGFPIGPLAVLDEVGIDVAACVGLTLVEAFGERMQGPPGAARLVEDGRLGRRSGRGFYRYDAPPAGPRSLLHRLGELAARRGKPVDPTVYPVLGLPIPVRGPRAPIAREEIQMRCALQLVNEALRCLGDGVLRRVRDGDVGAVLGLGFPSFRGGPFRYVDAVGADELLRRVRIYEVLHGARWAPAPLLVELAGSGRLLHPLDGAPARNG